jgi:cytochrome c oxidase cbb3-type subunit 3
MRFSRYVTKQVTTPVTTPAIRAVACAAALAIAAFAGGCGGSDKDDGKSDGGGTANTGGTASPGASTGRSTRPIALRTFNGNREDAVAGRQLFIRYNCYGCHGGLAGGAMGPSLRDDEWKYGGTDQAIHASIADGRPAGMPKFKDLGLTDQDINKIVVYIRSMRTDAEPTFFFSTTDTTTHAGQLQS